MKNLYIVLILLTLLIVGCGDTVSTQLNAESNKERADQLQDQNDELNRKIAEQETIIKNLKRDVVMWQNRVAYLECRIEYRADYVDYAGEKLEGADEKLAECQAINID